MITKNQGLRIFIISNDLIFIKVMETLLSAKLQDPLIEKLSSFRALKEKQLLAPPDMIIMDDFIPGAGSAEVLTFIRHDRRIACPVYLFCEKLTDNVKNSIGRGANRYFTRPFNLEVIAAEILNDLKNRADNS